MTRAANAIDRQLRDDPEDQGRAFDDDRILRMSPLSVVFAVDEGDRKAKVLAVRLTR